MACDSCRMDECVEVKTPGKEKYNSEYDRSDDGAKHADGIDLIFGKAPDQKIE